MKAIGTRSLGSLTSLSLVDVPQPEPGPGEVRVRVHASAVNPVDIEVVRWGGPARLLHAKVSPLVPGYDLSGVVDMVGAGVEDLSAGNAVFGHLAYSRKTRQGTFAELVTIDATQVANKPEGVDHRTAAAAATVGLTAVVATGIPSWLRVTAVAMPYVFITIDVFSWWATKWVPAAAYLTILGGFGYAVSSGFMILTSLYQMWWPMGSRRGMSVS